MQKKTTIKNILKLLATTLVVASFLGCNHKQAAEERWRKTITKAKLAHAQKCSEEHQYQLAQRLIRDCLELDPNNQELQRYSDRIRIKMCMQRNRNDGLDGL